MKIFINPGHCPGSDSGAVGYGLTEAEVALNIGRRVEKYLQAVGYDVKLFQYDGLAEIVDTSNYWNADLFISIHCNAFNGAARGTETIHYASSVEGKKLAKAIQRRVVNQLGTVDRGIKDKIAGGYDAYVVKYTDCPAVLVETAFIDNYADNQLLVNREDDFARAIACGITDYVAEHFKPDVVVVDAPPVRKDF